MDETYSSLAQHKKGDKVFINQIGISKVGYVKPNGIGEDTAQLMQKIHKELLTFSMEQNESNEVATIVNLLSNTVTEFVKGSQSEVNVEANAQITTFCTHRQLVHWRCCIIILDCLISQLMIFGNF